MDISLGINGYQVRFTQAQLMGGNGTTLLELLSAPYIPPSGSRWLAGLRLAAVTAPDGRSVGLGTASSSIPPLAAARFRVQFPTALSGNTGSGTGWGHVRRRPAPPGPTAL